MRCAVTERGTDSGTILVIGYGNELRGDDGLGPRVAQDISAANFPGVQVRSVCQLVPELAAEVAEARMVIFVDAAVDPDRITVELTPMTVHEATDWSTHIADPRTLIALTRTVYGRTPEAWWLTVPGQNFGFGEGLSTIARANAKNASERLWRLIAERQQWRSPKLLAAAAGPANSRRSSDMGEAESWRELRPPAWEGSDGE